MEMFNVHRRDIMKMDDYMDLKKPGFGGPSSAKMYRDRSGKKVNTDPKLEGYQRVVDRHSAFGHPVYNSTYKAMSNDLVYKQERKKPYNYPDPYSNMGLPIVNVGKAANEGFSYTSFQKFINEEMHGYGMNPSQEEKIISLRGKSDLDAIGDAEEKMDDMRISYDSFFRSEGGSRLDYLDQDGDLVAYIDIPKRKLYVMPDAPIMSDEDYAKMYGSQQEPEEEEYWEEDEDSRSRESEEGAYAEDDFGTESSTGDVSDIEQVLRSFEDDEDED